jgi:cyclase
MLKKRLIFTLIYDSGFFMLSRNFRLQRVGDIEWLDTNYDFSKIARFIDELIVLDVTRENRDILRFSEALKRLSLGCFVPISAGGGVRSLDNARMLLRSGADKVVINTPLFDDKPLVVDLAEEFGQQCLVGSVDVIKNNNTGYSIVTNSGARILEEQAEKHLIRVLKEPVGELYLNSIDQDGTGQGYDLALLDLIPKNCTTPIILAGGVGNTGHLIEGLVNSRVDAVATANLFNFIGNGLQIARESIVKEGHNLANWLNFAEMSFMQATDVSSK